MGSPTLSSHPKGYHARMDDTDTNMHYPKGFIGADDNRMIIKGNDSEMSYSLALQFAEIKVTSAELLAIATTPKTIISAPGSTLAVVPASGFFWYDYNSAAYSATDDLVFEYTDGTDVYKIAHADITGTADLIKKFTDSFTVGKENLAIQLTSASNPTTGDSPLYIWLAYYVIETW